MNYKFLFTAFVALMSMVLVGCSDDEATYLNEIRVSQSYVAIDKSGKEVSIDITTTDSWSFDESKDAHKIPDWLEVSPKSGAAGTGKITFKATEGTGRTCELVINCAGKVQHINVIQGKKEIEEATCAQVIAADEGKTFRVTGPCVGIYNTTYGNWFLDDGTGRITIYGTLDKNGQEKNFASLGIEVGDIVTVEGPKKKYVDSNGNETHELENVTVIKIVKSLIKVTEIENGTLPLEGGEAIVNLECKGSGVSVEIPADAKDWLSIQSVSSGTAPKVVFKAAPNTGGDRLTNVTFKTYDAKGAEYSAVCEIKQMGAIVDSSIGKFLEAAEDNTQYRLEGVVVGVTDAAKGRFTIRDYSGEVYVYNAKEFTGKLGDVVTVEGKRTSYNGTPQVGSGTVKHVIPVTEVSISEFLAKEDNKDVYYMVSGTIDEIANATFGNIYIKDAEGNRLYVYGTYPGWGATGDDRKNLVSTLGLVVGDKITVIGSKTTYKDTPQVNNGIYFSHSK